MTTYYTSNDATVGFDATASGSLPSDWTARAGTWKVGTTNPVGAHTRSFASTTDADGDVALLTGIAAHADMQVSFTQILPNGVGAAAAPVIAVILRSDSAYNNCYTWIIAPSGSAGQLRVIPYKRSGGSYGSSITGWTNSPQTFSTSGPITLNVVAEISGTSLFIKLWQLGTTEPATWDATTTDSGISAAGYAGLYNGLDGAVGARAVCDFTVADTGGDAETISVNTPSGETAGNSYSYSGSYTGTQPAALDFEFDAGGFGAAASPVISGGTWSFNAIAPAAGSHTLSVRDHNVTSISGTSGGFSTSGAAAAAVNFLLLGVGP